MARGNVHFQQHAWGYFTCKCLLWCSDDRSLPLVEKICDSMGLRAANRLRVDEVRSASCFSVPVSIKQGLRTTDCGLGIKYGLGIRCGLRTEYSL